MLEEGSGGVTIRAMSTARVAGVCFSQRWESGRADPTAVVDGVVASLHGQWKPRARTHPLPWVLGAHLLEVVMVDHGWRSMVESERDMVVLRLHVQCEMASGGARSVWAGQRGCGTVLGGGSGLLQFHSATPSPLPPGT